MDRGTNKVVWQVLVATCFCDHAPPVRGGRLTGIVRIFSSGEAGRRRQYRVYGKAPQRGMAERDGRSQFDLDLHAGRKLQAHQGLHGLGGGLDHVDQALVGAALELLTAVLVLVDGAKDGDVSTIFSAAWSMS